MSAIRLLCVVVLVITLLGCSTSRNVNAYYRAGFDFSSVQSYSTYSRNSSFAELQNISDSTRNTIEFAIEREFENNGFVFATQSEADIVVAYYLIGNNFLELQTYNQEVKYCAYCLRVDKVERKRLRKSYQPGSLVIDIINAKNQSSVWRSVYPLRIQAKDNSQDIEEKISQALADMIKEYPKQAQQQTSQQVKPS